MAEKEIRKDLIESKLNEIVESIDIISSSFPNSFEEFAELGLVKDGIYKKLEFAIEAIIDICAIINSDLRLGTPETEDSILENLGKEKIFNKK